jgi:hypothetical protein
MQTKLTDLILCARKTCLEMIIQKMKEIARGTNDESMMLGDTVVERI